MAFTTSMIPEQAQVKDRADELLSLCKKAVADCNNVKPTLDSLDKLRCKQRGSKVVKSQLKSLYTQAISEAEHQKATLMAALEKVSEIRALEYKLSKSKHSQPSFLGTHVGPKSFRRGVLMSVLQENAKSIPLWIGKPGESPPALCGATGPSPNIPADPGDHVAALVPEPDVAAAACNLSEGCILAEVVSYNPDKEIYEVEDVDAEEGKINFEIKDVIPLPKWKANPITNPEAIFNKGATVLALYPQTTCFYKAIVDEIPIHIHDEYSLYFEDSSYPEGYAPAIKIPQRYVIQCPDKEAMTSKHLDRSKKRGKKL
uniref:SAGA-associated factor 29-like protein n=1 Tax=Schistosoma haematobium TaxID=6185 RepID=A0A095B307_SCHHA